MAAGPVPRSVPPAVAKTKFLLRVCTCVIIRTYDMPKAESPEEVRRWFLAAIQKMWPVAEGSLSLRRSPCIRENCAACARGEGHQSYILYGRSGDRRVSMYVPDDLASEIRVAIDNGRDLQQLVNEAGQRYVKALKTARSKA
jgi:hypothetical protein